MDFTGINEFVLRAEFVSTKGASIKIIGTGSGFVNKNANGWCACNYGYKAFGVCWNCYLNKTYDIIKVNGRHVEGAYRRGTVLKMAGLKWAEVGLLCDNDSAVVGREFEEAFGVTGK